jgi:uncharacterized membrane protein YeaQ/YmgE (transglycosylase-associated protein family)
MEQGPIQFVQFVRFLDAAGNGWPALLVYGMFAGFLARVVTAREASISLVSAAALGVAGTLLAVAAAKLLGVTLAGVGARFLAAFAGSVAIAWLLAPLLALHRRRRSS